MILLKNCCFLSPQGVFEKGDILLTNGKISAIGQDISDEKKCEIIDLNGNKVIPGFIDIHMHGALGYDIMTASPSQINDIAEYLSVEGTTSFLPTTITSSINEIKAAIKNVKQACDMNKLGATIEGIHIEGPYISAKQKGCHDITKMKLPEIHEYEEYKALADDLKLHITIAPEINGALEFIELVNKDNNTISIGHSDADYETVNRAIKCGASIFTHLFNGMKGLHHREPGVAGAALVSNSFVELICDGVHVHEGVVKLIYKIKGKDKLVLVTDAMMATGLGDGQYLFGGFTINVVNGIARKEDGSLASSTLSMFKAVKNMIKFTGASLEEAVQMATLNPAKAVGINKETGSIEVGKRADLVVVDNQLNIISVFCKGKMVAPQ